MIQMALWRVTAVTPMPGYRLAVTFVDGTRGTADLSRLVTSQDAGIFGVLADRALFERVSVELGVVTWPNGADLDPDWMYEEISRRGEWGGDGAAYLGTVPFASCENVVPRCSTLSVLG